MSRTKGAFQSSAPKPAPLNPKAHHCGVSQSHVRCAGEHGEACDALNHERRSCISMTMMMVGTVVVMMLMMLMMMMMDDDGGCPC